MTRDEIDAALDRVRTWPLERRADAVSVLTVTEEQRAEGELSDEERVDLKAATVEADRGDVVPWSKVEARLDRYRLSRSRSRIARRCAFRGPTASSGTR